MLWTYISSHKASLIYLTIIVILTNLFAVSPYYYVAGEGFSPFDGMVGALYVFRNLSQREVGHWVIVLMIIGGILCYSVADVTHATTFAFIGGELTDFFIFSYLTGRVIPRVFWAAVFSSPVDSVIFLSMNDHLNLTTFTVMTTAKIFGAFIVIAIWDYFQQSQRI